MVSPSQHTTGVGHLIRRQVCSERKACQTLLVCRSHYQKTEEKHPDQGEQATLDASEAKPIWGIHKITSYLRAGHAVLINHKRVKRIRRKNNLQAYTKRKANRRAKMPMPVRPQKQASTIDGIWNHDFKQDKPQDERTARILVICDAYSHECLHLDSVHSYRSAQVMETRADSWKPQNASPATSEATTASSSKTECLNNGFRSRELNPSTPNPAHRGKTAMRKTSMRALVEN